MSLAGCVSGSPSRPVLPDRAALAPACPTPTARARLEAIAGYLEAAPPAAGLDALATEWERLDDGARACRGRP